MRLHKASANITPFGLSKSGDFASEYTISRHFKFRVPIQKISVDVDVIVEVATLAQYHLLSDQLRQLGFIEDASAGAPICRWKADDVILDVMPTDPKILGFGNQWFTLHTKLLNGLIFLLVNKYGY